MEAITAGIGAVVEIVETVLTTITGNTILTIFFCVPLLSIGINTLRKLKH